MLQPILALLLGLALGLAVTWGAGENPWRVLVILVRGAFGSGYDFGMTLFYATPLMFTGLSVAIAFRAGLFNIGAEGQLTLGALAAACVGITLPNLPAPLAPTLATLAAVAAGGAWAGIAGWLRTRRGSHEVITTIMLNFVAAGIASFVTLNLLRNPESQNPETAAIGPGFRLAAFGFFEGAPVSLALCLALAAAAAFWFLIARTVPGFKMRAVGENEPAARAAGIEVARTRLFAMILAGACAGLVAVPEVLGNAGRFKVGFSPDYGFLGIAVAFLGRHHPGGILLAALLFGALHKGTADPDLETEKVTRDLSLILQGLVILAVSAEGLWDWLQRKPRPAQAHPAPEGLP